MGHKPIALDHVNVFVRDAERALAWYTDILGLHVQDISRHPDGRMRAAFLACDPDHAHDIALFAAGADAAAPQPRQVGLTHVAWRMASLDDLADIYRRLQDRGVDVRVADHTVSIGVYFADPDGNGLEVYYELPRSQWHQEHPFSESGKKGRFPGPWDELLRQQAPAPVATPA